MRLAWAGSIARRHVRAFDGAHTLVLGVVGRRVSAGDIALVETAADSVILYVDPAAPPPAKPSVRIISPANGATYTLQGVAGHATVLLSSDSSTSVTQYHWADQLGLFDDTLAHDTVTLTPRPSKYHATSLSPIY
jgi:hypothetical protein